MKERKGLFKVALPTAEPLAAVCPLEWVGCEERWSLEPGNSHNTHVTYMKSPTLTCLGIDVLDR